MYFTPEHFIYVKLEDERKMSDPQFSDAYLKSKFTEIKMILGIKAKFLYYYK